MCDIYLRYRCDIIKDSINEDVIQRQSKHQISNK